VSLLRLAIFAVQTFFEGADASAKFACDLANSSNAEEQNNDGEDDEQFGGT
jgi:hypothetical protein